MYIVEGNIGAGKSTFTQLVAEHLSYTSVALESSHSWKRQDHAQSLLAHFYQKPDRWAYTLETLTMTCRVKQHIHEQNNNRPFRLVERSIYSGYHVFAYNSYQSGYMNDVEWKVYKDWFNFLITGRCTQPLGFIYLKVNPEIAFERIKKRDHLEEKKLTIEYLQQLDKYHEMFLRKQHNVLDDIKDVPVLTLDCNQDFENNPEVFAKHLDRLKAFFTNTQRFTPAMQEKSDTTRVR